MSNRVAYRVTFTPDEVRALEFLGPRGYCGADVLLRCMADDSGLCELTEPDAWAFRDSACQDGEQHCNDAGDTVEEWPYWTCAAPKLVEKLQALYDSII